MRSAIASFTFSLLGSFGPTPIADVGRGVEIRESPGKGLGAFATDPMPEGSYLGRYTGVLRTPEEAIACFDAGETSSNYFATIANGAEPLVIDAEDADTSAWPRYINHSLRRANCRNTELNLPFVLPGGLDLGKVSLGLYIRTLRDIEAGEELLMDYGDYYWTSRGLAPMD